MKKFFVTTPIYYINDLPHIGHAYSTIAADILVRYYRAKGAKTFLLTGSDENSQKTLEAAKKENETPNEYVGKMAKVWKETWDKLDIAGGDFHFIRTTDEHHIKFAQEFFQNLFEKGFIEKGDYEGLYCIGHEAFLRADELDESGLCPEHKRKPEQRKEKNYFFKLSLFQKKLLDFYKEHPDFIEPPFRKNEVVSFVKKGLEDISISRETDKWGIRVPFDQTQSIYVWFEALLSYYSETPKELWPADLHLIGKEILRFHTVIWPAMLMAAGLPLPKKIFAHGFFTIKGTKISKSLGNTIDPLKIAQDWGIDTLRYFLFKEFPFGNDGDFSFERLREVYNSDLANGLGNLVARLARLAETLNIEVPRANPQPLFDTPFAVAVEKLAFQQALDYIWNKIHSSDKNLEETKPWELLKENPEKAVAVVENQIRQIREIQELLHPFLPQTAAKIASIFAGPKIKAVQPLFPRK